MCQSYAFIILGCAATLVQGTFFFAEKKEALICKKVCPLYCKDLYKKGSQRRWDYDISTQGNDMTVHKPDSNENYRDTYNFYFGQPSHSSSSTTTEEPTLISTPHRPSMYLPTKPQQDFPFYPSPKEFLPEYDGHIGEIEEEYIYPYHAPYYYSPHFKPETTTPSTTTTTEEPTFICMVCLRKCPPR